MVFALFPVCLHVVLGMMVAVVMFEKNFSAADEVVTGFALAVAALSSIIGGSVNVGLLVGATVAIAVLSGASVRVRSLIGCCAVTYWVEVTWAVIGLVAVFVWDPPALNGANVQAHAAALASSPFLLTYNLVGAYFSLWVVVLHAVALRVVSGFSVRGAWVVGILLGSVFVAVPWAIQRFY